MNPVINERITALAQAVRSAGHGEKQQLIADAARELGKSTGSIYRRKSVV